MPSASEWMQTFQTPSQTLIDPMYKKLTHLGMGPSWSPFEARADSYREASFREASRNASQWRPAHR